MLGLSWSLSPFRYAAAAAALAEDRMSAPVAEVSATDTEVRGLVVALRHRCCCDDGEAAESATTAPPAIIAAVIGATAYADRPAPSASLFETYGLLLGLSS